MNNIGLLDCTLRDGGYINDWNFGFHTIRDILKKLAGSRVDFAEVGFLRNCEYDRNRALFNNCSEIASILPEKHENTLFTAMALHNKYDINKLEPYDGKTIEAVRVTFHDYDIDEGLIFIQKVMDKGYKVFCNPINIMGYSDDMVLRLIQKVNQIRPYAFSIVDTFGSMMKSDLQRLYFLVEHNLDKSVVVGLHLHENLALSYSLSQEFIAMKASERRGIIDGSMLGMGRVPGNLCLELIMDYMNRNYGQTYDVNPVLDGIDDYIVRWKEAAPWGYNTAYALSAKYNLHRNYAEFLLNKGRLRAKQINQLLSSIEESKKTAYDESYIEDLYEKFQDHEADDKELLERLKRQWEKREILILAPGSSIVEEKGKIEKFIAEKRPVIVSANFIPELFDQDYAFFSNPMRYSMIEDKCDMEKVLVTSNLIDICNTDNILNYAELYFDEKGKCDNCVIMLLKLMIKLGKKQVYVAGFDGYQSEKCNYISSYMASQYTKGLDENIRNKNYLTDIRKKINVKFLTASLYDR